ncbi:MAG: transcriptional regulator [Solibacillus isronensis]
MIKIGVITAQHSIPEIKQIEPYIEDDCLITFLPYKQIDEITDLYEQNHFFFDGILFSGNLGYNVLLQKLGDFRTPTYYLDITEGDFYKQLFSINITHKKLNFSRVGMDIISPDNNFLDLHNVIAENEFPKVIEVNYNEKLYDYALSQYLSLWNNGEIDLVLTRISNIVNSLKISNIPTVFIFPSKESILEQVKFIINELQINKLQESQGSIGLVTVRNPAPLQNEELQLVMLHKALLEYNSLHKVFTVIQHKLNRFELITTQADLKATTSNYTKSDLQDYLLSVLPFEVNIGWGIGSTFFEAKKNAQIANNHAASEQTSSTYVITANKEMIGPLGNEVDLAPETTDYPQLQKISDATGISIVHLKKLVVLWNKLEESEVSADDIAYQLNVSNRQANRILNKLEDVGVATVSHKRQEKSKGRPKKIYSLGFSNNVR